MLYILIKTLVGSHLKKETATHFQYSCLENSLGVAKSRTQLSNFHFISGSCPGFPGGSDDKESACSVGDLGLITGFDPWVGIIPWRRPWQPSPTFLPGESPWTEEHGGLQSMGSQRIEHDWASKHNTAQAHVYIFVFLSQNICTEVVNNTYTLNFKLNLVFLNCVE